MKITLTEFLDENGDLFEEKQFRKDDYFIEKDMINYKIGIISKGIMRGFTTNEKGDCINLLFFKENDFLSGNLVPNSPAVITIQAISDCSVWITDFSKMMERIRNIETYNHLFNTYLNSVHTRIQKRLISFIDLNAQARYQFFLKEYPNLMNRIPHYMVANFLGITPTQLSRVRKEFVKK